MKKSILRFKFFFFLVFFLLVLFYLDLLSQGIGKQVVLGNEVKSNRIAVHNGLASRIDVLGSSLNITKVGEWGTGPYQDVFINGNYAYCAASYAGLDIIDISNPAVPVLVGNYDISGEAIGVYVSGSYAYVADRAGELNIIDISDPAAPTLTGSYWTSGYAYDVYVSSSYAYVANGSGGLKVIDISDPAAPALVGNYTISGSANGVYVSGSYAYVANGIGGLKVIDISNPIAPSLVGSYDTSGYAEDVFVSGSYAYVADGYGGLQVIDISDPAALTQAGSFDTSGYSHGVYISGSYAYIADDNWGLKVIDISDPGAPALAGNYDTLGSARGVYVSSSYAFVADDVGGLKVIDISNPIAPSLVGSYDTSGYACDVYVSGNYAYVAYQDIDRGELNIIDISDPAVPTQAGSYDISGWPYGVYVSGSYAYVANGSGGLKVIDISDPAAPALVGSYTTSGSAIGVYVSSNYAYVADTVGLKIIDISNPAAPVLVGNYDISGEARGVYISGSYAYVVDGGGELNIIDISDPAAPSLVGSYDTSGYGEDVYVSGSYAYVANGSGGLKVIDISNPAAPALMGSYTTSGSAMGVYVSSNYAYVADTVGLKIVDISDPAAPTQAGSYDISGWTYEVYVSGSYAYVANYNSGKLIIFQITISELIIVSPNGGEYWQAGTAQDITWTSSGSIVNVKIEYSIDNGTSWTEVISSTMNDGVYEWTVPNTPSTACLIKISNISDDSTYDISDSVFTIISTTDPFIYSLSPTSGQIGTTVTISGSNFGDSQGTVTFNGVIASVTSWTDTQIQTVVPDGATTGPVVVHTASGKNSNGMTFTVEEGILTQLVVGGLTFYANSIIQSGSIYTLSGNVNINGKIWFSGDVSYISSTTYSGTIESEGYPYIKIASGDKAIFTSTDISYLVNGNEMSLKPIGLDFKANYDFALSGIPLWVTSEPIKITSSGVIISGSMAIGSTEFLLCRVDVSILFEYMGDIYLQNLNIDANNPSQIPGIGVKSISLNYDGATDELTGSAELNFPFLGIDSVEAAISIISGCIDGFRIEVALEAGIMLGTTGLKITGFTLEVDNICDPPHFYIFMGGDLGIAEVPTDIFVLDDSGLGYQHPYRLNIERGTAKLFNYQITSLSGYIDASGKPDKTGAGIRGTVDFGGFYVAEVDLQLLVLLPKFTGKGEGVLQIPALDCDPFDFQCLAIKTALEALGIALPYKLTSQEMDIEVEEQNGEWTGRIRGRVLILDWSFAAALNYDSSGLHFLIGKNYESLIHILGTGELRTLAGTTEQILIFPSDQEHVIFAAQGNIILPEIYLKTPSGEVITSENVSSYSGINYSENNSDLVTVFTVDKVTAGTWTFGVSNLDASEVHIDILSPRPIPQTSFTEVTQSGGIINIMTTITATRPDTRVSLFYSDRSSGGIGTPIVEDVSASGGLVSASWDTTKVDDGTYYLFAKTFDDSDIMIITYYGEPIVVNNKGIEAPSNLQGSRNGDTVFLNWTESQTPEVVGYTVLYTDEPEVGGYKYQKGANESNQAEITGLDPNKEYRFAVVAFDGNGNFSIESNTYYTSDNVDANVWKISDGTPISDDCASGDWQYYKIEVPEESDKLEVKTIDATGNIDLYVRKNGKPEFNLYDFKVCTPSGDEILEIKASSSPPLTGGEWYIGVYGNEAASYNLIANISRVIETPEISLDRTSLYFGAYVGGVTSSQELHISNSGGGTLNWSVSDNAGWLSCSPTSGTGAGVVSVVVNVSGLAAGTYQGTITVIDPLATNSPQTVSVTLRVYGSGGNSSPFGVFDTPAEGATVYGNIPVTGWALDDVEVTKVEIKRAPVSGDPAEAIGPDGLVYIGDAVFVEEARPDVEMAYPGYPLNYRAGWGYMMLTNFLPNSGNGTFTIYAIAYDREGNKVTLGTKSIICDNANSEMPFGTIDTPEQGGVVSGASYVNFGWALTPQPKYIPYDGSTIWVWVDGVPLGNPVYNNYRADIATLFPGYANSDGAVGYYYLDTTALENGVHNIAWSVTDSAGKTEGIGSRYFNVFNGSSGAEGNVGVYQGSNLRSEKDLVGIMTSGEPVYVKRGYDVWCEPQPVYPDEEGIIRVEIRQVERVVMSLQAQASWYSFEFLKADTNRLSLEREFLPASATYTYVGYQKVKGVLRALPLGSWLDASRGVFFWQPGAGFLGDYELVFLKKGPFGYLTKQVVQIRIKPKF